MRLLLIVDIRNLKMRSLLKPQPARVDRCQADSIARQADHRQDLSRLLDTEDCWQPFVARRPNEAQRGPLSVERVLEEELDPT